MSIVLYRKYRPQTFRELTNQNHIKITLEQEIAQGKCGHAFVFSGPRGVGKTSSARILAKAINCLSRPAGSGEPCNKCAACQEITEGRSLDILEIDAASHTGVDMVRETIIETARFAPSRLKYKIFIIDEAHMLSTPAWNALLKILEEPPGHVIFILATTESHKIPATILSRCQRFEFKRLSSADMIERLKFLASQEKRIVAPGVYQAIARLAEGSVRDAESLLEQVFALDEKEITEDHAALILPRSSLPLVLDFLSLIFRGQAKEAVEMVNHLTLDGFDLEQFAADVIEILRKMILLKIKADAQATFSFDLEEELEKRVKEAAVSVSVPRLIFLIELFLRKRQELKNAVIPQLPLELAVVEACGEGMSFNPQKEPVMPGNPSKPMIQIAEKTAIKKKEIKEEIANDVSKDAGKEINLEQVKNCWAQVLIEAQKDNPSLPFILKLSEPISVEKNRVKIGVGYAFHRDQLNTDKNRLYLEKIIGQQLDAKVRVEGILVERANQSNGALDEALKTFGGKVVG